MFAINFDLLTCHDNFGMKTTRMWCCSQQHIPVFIQSSIQNANASKDCGLAKIWKQHAMAMGRMVEIISEIGGLCIVSTCYIGWFLPVFTCEKSWVGFTFCSCTSGDGAEVTTIRVPEVNMLWFLFLRQRFIIHRVHTYFQICIQPTNISYRLHCLICFMGIISVFATHLKTVASSFRPGPYFQFVTMSWTEYRKREVVLLTTVTNLSCTMFLLFVVLPCSLFLLIPFIVGYLSERTLLTPPLLVPHVSMNWVNIGSGNGLSHFPLQANTWSNFGLLLIGPLEIFSEISFANQTLSFKKMRLIISSAKLTAIFSGEMS